MVFQAESAELVGSYFTRSRQSRPMSLLIAFTETVVWQDTSSSNSKLFTSVCQRDVASALSRFGLVLSAHV